MIAEEDEGVNLHRIEPYRASEDASTEVRDERSRLEQEPPLQRPAGDLDERAGWMKADTAPHEDRGRNPLPAVFRQAGGT